MIKTEKHRACLELAMLLTGLAALPAGAAVTQQAKVVVPNPAAAVLENFCQSCHEEGTTKGDVRIDNLAELPPNAQLDLLNRMLEQVYLRQMPPKKKTQPSEAERDILGKWLTAELRARNAARFEEKLRFSSYGNSVDHDKLFSGNITEMPYTPARRWLVSPQIFNERVQEIFEPEERGRQGNLYGVTNPFQLPDTAGVRYYDNGTLDGGSLLVMLTNAEWIASKQIRPARVKNGELGEKDFPNPQDRWAPKKCPPAFETIVLKKSAPTDDEMKAAIRVQYDRVLRREPAPEEMAKALDLIRTAISAAGNTEGLKQMLVAVLLDSEFLYRLEFGAGTPDQFGRKMLSPREAAYAISYALGDRGPDAKLLQAASQGKLNTKEDYKREVLRLLDDQTYYKGFIDPVLQTRNMKPQETSHPRIVRFFREYFGYPNAAKVFKDTERSGFFYRNPDRGSLGTSGDLINEADMLVDAILKKDQHVFETLLGTEEFYVAPIADAANKMTKLEELYNKFKDTDWKKDPEKVTATDPKYVESILGYRSGAKQLKEAMIHVEKFREKNLRPNPQWNYAFGTNLMLWVNAYNFAPFEWQYPEQQPFKVPNRKGVLTHPAWLIAFSQNTQSDPVTRGRWVREKLLAGRTPDVPINVDAVIPEDHTATLRTRLDKATKDPSCWKCHQLMNPLGVTFEIYDDFGRYRTEESLEHPDNVVGKKGGGKYQWNVYKTLPVDAHGELDGTGDPSIEGPVKDATDLISRLAKSKRARQSMIRYAFRFYMGRNEKLSDSKTLIDADNAYLQSGGSFKAVIVSLLTSDSFMYRK